MDVLNVATAFLKECILDDTTIERQDRDCSLSSQMFVSIHVLEH